MTLDELKRFCADAACNPREYLLQPWTRDGYTWASNGHIVVRVPATDLPDNEKAPDCAALFAKQPDAIEWLSVPPVKALQMDECDDCYGGGTHECVCGNEHTCVGCNGSGKVKAKTIAIPVGNSHFADHYLHMIQGWQIAPNAWEPAWIRNDDALGLLMPRRP